MTSASLVYKNRKCLTRMPTCFRFLHFLGNKRRVLRWLICVFIFILTKQYVFVTRLEIAIKEEPSQFYDIRTDHIVDGNSHISGLDNNKGIFHTDHNTYGTDAKFTTPSDSNDVTSQARFFHNDTSSKKEEAAIKRQTDTIETERTGGNIINFFHIYNISKKDPLLNLHQYEYSTKSKMCHNYKPDIVIFIHSSTINEYRREVIRKSWGKYTRISNFQLSTIFMLGQTNDNAVQRKIQQEAQLHGDIVQGNFIDAYKNLTYKHIMAFHWLLSNCPTAKLFVKVDDDVLVNVFNLVDYISKKGFQSNLLYCSILNQSYTMRQKRDKWYVSEDEYPFRTYPNYCYGMAYLISPDVAKILYNASENTRFYWVDDVYVTGILTLKVGQELTSMEEGHWSARMRSYHRSSINGYMFLVGTQLYSVLWKALMSSTPDELKANV